MIFIVNNFGENSPLLMGSLWDITDKDTDVMTEKLLKVLKSSKTVVDLNQALMVARKYNKRILFIKFIILFNID